MTRFPALAVASCTLLFVVPLAAQHEWSEHEEHRHHLAVLFGGSHNTKKDGSTIGGDYEYRFLNRFGALASFEYVGGDFREDVFAFTGAWHPWKGLRLIAGPGFDRELRQHEEPGHGETAETHGKYRALLRTGAAYEFHIRQHFTIGPEIAVDVLNGEKVFVYGINFGWGFGRRP